MWRVDSIAVTPVEFDFSSSDQGRLKLNAIDADGIRLFNAIELVEFDAAVTQVQVCSSCGISRCAPGNWVALRRVGDSVVWIPAVARMGSEESRAEYSPPAFVVSRGMPLFRPSTWQNIRGLRDGVPEVSELPELTSREAVQVLQLLAPRRVLGEYPYQPRLHREVILASTEGAVEAEALAVDLALAQYCERSDVLHVVPAKEVRSRIEFWLDIPGVPGWTAFGRSDKGVVLIFGEELVLSL